VRSPDGVWTNSLSDAIAPLFVPVPPPASPTAAGARIAELERALIESDHRRLDALAEDVAHWTGLYAAHRGCTGTEHDPENGKLHGYCVVCGVPWPCDVAVSGCERAIRAGGVK